MDKEINFSEVRLGQSFIAYDNQYERMRKQWKGIRYGFVNAFGPAMYVDDSGYRYFQDDEKVVQI